MGFGAGGTSSRGRLGYFILALAFLTACDSDQVVTTSTTGPGDPSGHSQPEGPERLIGHQIIRGRSGVVMEDLHLSNPDGDCLRIVGSTNIVVRNVTIGPCGGRAIVIERSSGVVVEAMAIGDSRAGIYALNSSGVVVSESLFNDTGRNPIQFDKVTGPGNAITGNLIINLEGSPSTEDSINVYSSGGTEVSPLIVADNFLRNGGSSRSGSGILVGDNGGTHTVVRGNTLINPGQVGIGVAGGRNIVVVDNLVFSESFPWTNVGIYVWDQYESNCGDIEVTGNVVEWYNGSGDPNRFFDAGNCGQVQGWDDNEPADDLATRMRDWMPSVPGSW